VRGALAMDPDAVLRDPVRGPHAVPSPPPAVPEQRERPAPGPVRITTLQPASYKEARTIGEHYRDGQPVIMNLTELDAADAKRLVDFAAGLAFALRGSIDKVTSRVFLLTPADVEVSADDARRLAQRSVFRHD
jgi:cell division inhibitor SepF